jgi:co-chaperonin GroES (HSP10)
MSLQPLDDNVLVEIVSKPKLSTVIHMIEKKELFQQACWLGKVLAVGPGWRLNSTRIKTTVTVNDMVIFPGLPVMRVRPTYMGDNLVLIRERDILAVVDDPEKLDLPKQALYE